MKRVYILAGMILLAVNSLTAKEFICNTDKPYVRTMTIDSSGKDSLPSTIEANCFYKMDFAPFADGEKKSSLCKVDVFNERGKISRTEMIVADNNGHYTGTVLASQNTLLISLESSVTAVARLDTLFYCKIEKNGKNVQLAAGKDFRKADKYRRMAADERLISFLEGVNARQVCTRDPDAVLELCINKIAELASDDFEKVFLIHDAIWYLVSYDNLSYKILDPKNQDYVSNLKRGVCVCEGFAKLFSQMCLLMDIPACDVYGWGVNQTDNGKEQGGLHAWNIVMVQNKWYTIDVTWDCSHSENGKRDGHYSTAYIFQKPKEFVKMHHPSSPEFQLLKKPLKFDSVENIVKYQGI